MVQPQLTSKYLTALCAFSLCAVGERIWRVRVRNLMVWDKGNLTSKAKAAHVSKAKHSPLPMSKKVFSHPQESRAPSQVTVTGADKHHPSKHSPLPSPSLGSICWAKHPWSGISLWSSWGQLSPHNSLCTPCLLTDVTVGETEKALTQFSCCWAEVTQSLCYQQCFQHKFKTQPHASYCEKS